MQGFRTARIEGVALGHVKPDVTVRVARDGGAALVGRVRDKTGHPLADVILEASSGEFPTDAEGRFRVTGLASGSAHVKLSNQFVFDLEADVPLKGSETTRDFVVETGGPLSVEIDRARLTTVQRCRVRVKGADGTVLRQLETTPYYWQHEDGAAPRASLFSWGPFAPGSYTVVVDLDYRPLPDRTVEIRNLERTVIVVEAP